MHDFAVWLGKTSLHGGLAQEIWIIPVLQSVHILAIAMVLSAVAIIDLRLLGIVTVYSLEQAVSRFVPLIWTGLAILLMTGAILIVAEPKRTLNGNPAFYLKMGMLVVAVGVTVAFQAAIRRNVALFSVGARHRHLLQVSALATLALWFAIAIAGRWIAYVQVG